MICIPPFVSEILVCVVTTILSESTRDASVAATVRVEAARPVDAENAPTGLCKTADGFAQLPHASSSRPFQKNEEDQNPSESLVTDPQILRTRHNFFQRPDDRRD